MMDRIVNGALWVLVMALIAISAMGALLLSYRGLFDLCAQRISTGTAELCAGTFIGVASYLLARHANDLMDR